MKTIMETFYDSYITIKQINSIIELLLSYEKDSNNYSNSNDLSNNTHNLYLFGDVENFY